ncbi:hypothetical protein Bbelb_096150 [Branchiostoma belcheri]|nr:hypothetical protein Bbelb_096150 [Branchiostoma belcheri]
MGDNGFFFSTRPVLHHTSPAHSAKRVRIVLLMIINIKHLTTELHEKETLINQTNFKRDILRMCDVGFCHCSTSPAHSAKRVRIVLLMIINIKHLTTELHEKETLINQTNFKRDILRMCDVGFCHCSTSPAHSAKRVRIVLLMIINIKHLTTELHEKETLINQTNFKRDILRMCDVGFCHCSTSPAHSAKRVRIVLLMIINIKHLTTELHEKETLINQTNFKRDILRMCDVGFCHCSTSPAHSAKRVRIVLLMIINIKHLTTELHEKETLINQTNFKRDILRMCDLAAAAPRACEAGVLRRMAVIPAIQIQIQSVSPKIGITQVWITTHCPYGLKKATGIHPFTHIDNMARLRKALRHQAAVVVIES